MLKKIALLVVMFALPLGAMAQAKFAHMNSQEVITVMPEFTKAQADLDAMSKKYQDEMQRTNEEFQKKYQEYLVQQDSLPKNIAERRQKELNDMAQRQEQFQQEAYQSMQKAQQDAGRHRRNGKAEHQHDGCNGQHRLQCFQQFFPQFGDGCLENNVHRPFEKIFPQCTKHMQIYE